MREMAAQVRVARHRKPNVLLMENSASIVHDKRSTTHVKVVLFSLSFQFLSFVLLLLCNRSFHILIISTKLKLDFDLFIALSDCVVLVVCSLLARTLWPNQEEEDESCHYGSYRGLNRVASDSVLGSAEKLWLFCIHILLWLFHFNGVHTLLCLYLFSLQLLMAFRVHLLDKTQWVFQRLTSSKLFSFWTGALIIMCLTILFFQWVGLTSHFQWEAILRNRSAS